MARPSKLSPVQRAEVTRRLAEGEGVRALAKEFCVDPSMVSRLGVAQHTQQVRSVAQQLADAQSSLVALPIAQQYIAVSLADKLRNISTSLAAAGELGAATSHRLHALANNEVVKIDDSDPLASLDALKGVAVLTRMANESAVVGLGLLAANKEAVQKFNAPPADADVTVIELVALLPR